MTGHCGHPFNCKGSLLVKFSYSSAGLPLQDLIVGASVYFPPLFKAVFVGFFIWLVVHRLLRDWMYSGEIWHPMLMDLSLFALSVSLGLAVLIVW
ncbi:MULTISPECIES: DUF1656 domain-containing protein [Enterobacter]|uniref:DUF1656 domain-containing protein n=1 Tax=Enterobacter TaxID=547 RepID=UPI0020B8FB7D